MADIPQSPRSAPHASARDGVRFAFGTLTVLPVSVARWDREAARRGMVCAPLVGVVVGLLAAAVAGVLLALGAGTLLTGIAAVAVGAVLTRGLHLDGLADVADGLGSGKPAEAAQQIMKRSDIGPFGTVTLVLVLGGQVAALSELYAASWAWGALGGTVAAVAARTALTLAVRRGVPAARPDGLGATVAGTVPVRTAYLLGAGVAVVAGASGALFSLLTVVQCAAAVVLGLAAAEGLLAHCRRRLGGVTGDVLGALTQVAGTATLVVLALG